MVSWCWLPETTNTKTGAKFSQKWSMSLCNLNLQYWNPDRWLQGLLLHPPISIASIILYNSCLVCSTSKTALQGREPPHLSLTCWIALKLHAFLKIECWKILSFHPTGKTCLEISFLVGIEVKFDQIRSCKKVGAPVPTKLEFQECFTDF